MQFLDISLIIGLHKELILKFGGLAGIRDKRLLESALAYPMLLYAIQGERDVYVLAAAYAYHLIHNHPFLDGNKRIGMLTMLTFLKLNNIPILIPHKALYRLAMNITTQKIKEVDIATLLKSFPVSFDA